MADGRLIDDTDFKSFLDLVVTPHFPEGFTVFDATGRFMTARGVLVDESTKVMLLVYPDTEEVRDRIGQIIAMYRARFQQESVGWVRSSACASF